MGRARSIRARTWRSLNVVGIVVVTLSGIQEKTDSYTSYCGRCGRFRHVRERSLESRRLASFLATTSLFQGNQACEAWLPFVFCPGRSAFDMELELGAIDFPESGFSEGIPCAEWWERHGSDLEMILERVRSGFP